MSAPLVVALADLFSRDSLVARWHDLIDFARTDTIGFCFWAAVWAGSVCVTFLLLRMLFTRWGDTNVTQKTMALSLLAHLLLALLSTRMVFSQGGGSAGRGSGRELIMRPLRRNVVAGDSAPIGRSPGRSPVWERPPDLDRGGQGRLERAPTDAIPAELTERIPEPAAEPAPLPPVQTPIAEVPIPAPQPERSAAQAAPTLPAPGAPVVEETAAARAEAGSAAAGSQRTARDVPDTSKPEISRGSRPQVEGDVSAVAPPIVANNSTSAVEPPAAVARDSQSGASPVTAGNSPATAPIGEPGEPAPPSQAASGSVPQKGFTRAGRQLSQPVAADAVERRRQGDGVPAGDPDRVIAVRPGSTDLPTDLPRPELARPEVRGAIEKDDGKVPAPYRLRGLPGRKKFAIDMGATDESERAVEASLEWLARHQHAKGFWQPIESTLGHEPDEERFGADLPLRQRSGLQAESGLTALALLAFLGANCTHEDNLYADNVDRALRWLISQQESDGYLGGRANKYAGMYCHGMATIALGEAYGMTKDQALREPLIRAVQYIIDQQSSIDGGWRYVKGKFKGDMSMFGWQLMALKSASTAGLKIPREPVQKAYDFIEAHGRELKTRGMSEHGGLAAYREWERPKPSMTAEALFCRQILRFKHDDPAVVEAVEYLERNIPRRSQQDLYYWYYGTLAMYHHGGEPWRRWNNALRDNLVADQRTDGDFAGSWNPRNPWGDYGGRVFSTALSTLCLEVYYRYLPLYQMTGKASDDTQTR